MSALQNQHHRLAARAVRLGYNVLKIDADVFFLNDPYHFFKRPPYGDAHLITQGELGSINVGVMYAQNASRGGPVVWLWAEIVDRMIRWSEDDFLE